MLLSIVEVLGALRLRQPNFFHPKTTQIPKRNPHRGTGTNYEFQKRTPFRGHGGQLPQNCRPKPPQK
jgi:hypothetical protein